MKKTYSKEVEKLFFYGETNISEPWPNYVVELNLKRVHINELIELIINSDLSKATSGFTIKDFAPRHAWRALGQLKAIVAIKTLLDALIDEKNEEAFDYRVELPYVFLLIGDKSIIELELFLKNEKIEWNYKLIIFETLVKFAIQKPIHKELIINISNDLIIKYNREPYFISYILNALFKIEPVNSEIVKEVIHEEKYDFTVINKSELIEFIRKSKMYD